jgi:predicted ATPase/DNA-binding CsgD family transcriptional regulator
MDVRPVAQQVARLPTEVTSFVDRRRERAEVKRLLSVGRLLTLTGPAGVGKTRLAVRVAGELSRAFPDGVWMVSLATIQDDALVPHAVADMLGIRDDTGGQPLEVIVEHLRERRLLLVLDNCEHLIEACAALVSSILPRAAWVRVLATSRHRLNLSGEHLLDVSPLRVPTPEDLAEGVLAAKAFPALELFADRATAVAPGFTLTAGNLKHMARLCDRLDGLPLAIELAAVRVQSYSLVQLVERLDDRYRLLTGGSHSVLPHHQTLRAAIDWSYQLCTRQEQLVWALLSVFAGSFDLGAAEAVCAGEEGGGHTNVLDTIAGLVDKSILVSERHGDTVRYRLLSSLLDYGLEKLTELGKVSAARLRYRDHYLYLAEEYERHWFGPRQLEIMASLRAELDNFRAALTFCVGTPDEAQHGLRLAAVLWCYWVPCRANLEMRHWLHQALREGAKLRDMWAKAYWIDGLLVMIHSRSAAVLLAGGPPGQSAQAHGRLPIATPVADYMPDWRLAENALLSFVVISRIELACSLVFQAKPDQAVPLCDEVLAICEARKEQWARSYVLRTLALARWTMGEYDSAITHARECLRLKYVVHDQHSLGRTLDLLAAIAAGKGETERAAVLQGAAERIWHDVGRNPLERPWAGRIRASERQARETLGDRGFEQARRRGGELSRDDVVAYALQDRSRTSAKGARAGTRTAVAGESSDIRLTPRERQVAELVAQGLTDKQIAATLVIGLRTAEGHVQRILTKRGFTNRTQLAAWINSQQTPGEQP